MFTRLFVCEFDSIRARASVDGSANGRVVLEELAEAEVRWEVLSDGQGPVRAIENPGWEGVVGPGDLTRRAHSSVRETSERAHRVLHG
ncbi:unnamed protein product [Diplocarpon coronariae]